MTIGWEYEIRWIEWFAIPIASIFIRNYYLQYTNFLSLSDKETVIVSPVITFHTLRKKGEIETVSFLTRPHKFFVPWHRLNWLNGWNIKSVWCRLLGWLYVKIGRWKIAKGYMKKMLVGIVWITLLKSNGVIERWKLTEVEERIFSGYCTGGCMHK